MNFNVFYFTLAITVQVKAQCPSLEWGYSAANGPSESTCWPDDCQTGKLQSPIDIPYHRNLTVVKNWLPIRWLNYHEGFHHLNITNTGTAVKIDISRDCNRPRIKNGGLGSYFELDHILIHWGSKHSRGSEHQIQGDQYSAEVQFVHINEKCGRSLTEATEICVQQNSFSDTFAVLSVLLEVGDDANMAYDSIFDALSHIKYPTSSYRIDSTELIKLYPDDKEHFYRYQGSMTTPELSCAENVVWTIFKDPVRISKYQLSKLWRLRTNRAGVEEPLTNNFRPIQALNDREVIFADLDLECDEKGWKSPFTCNMKYREQSVELGFYESYKSCLSESVEDTEGLIPVGQLRCLRNNFDYGVADNVNTRDICGRFFRVNAIKGSNGKWKEYGSGNWVPTHHFPDFDPTQGKEGDTLVWDALVNRLIIADSSEHYLSMCYKIEETCGNCAGYYVGHECSDSGTCDKNECECDSDFLGKQCGVSPLPNKDVLQFGSLDGPYELRINTYQTSRFPVNICKIPQFSDLNPTAQVEMFCDFAFGRAFCCGGHEHPDPSNSFAESTLPNTNICGYLDCHHQMWKRIHDFPLAIYYEAAVVAKNEGEDYAWIVSGGEYGTGTESVMQDKMYIMRHDLRWETLNTVMPTPRSGHCSVQINDCEIALIGGGVNVEHNEFSYVADSYERAIDIYNFKTNSWRAGPELPEDMLAPACASLRDEISNELIVVIGCDSLSNNVYTWNVGRDEIFLSEFSCPNDDQGLSFPMKFKALDNQNLFVVNGFVNFRFNLETGFSEQSFTFGPFYVKGDSAVTPPGTYDCTVFTGP